MLPSLNAYARAITGDPKVTIQITSDNGSSERHTIYFQPPIRLGDKTPHDLMHCNKRNAAGFQICLACRIREHIMAVIYHELGHITQGTFERFSLDDVAYLLRVAVPLWGRSILAYRNKAEKHIVEIESRTDDRANDFMNLCAAAHPWLPKIFNAIEDARVNERIFRIRPGVRAMYEAMMAEVQQEGIPEPGTTNRVMWRDCADDFQIVLAVYAKLAGYNSDSWFRWNIVTAARDVELNEIFAKFSIEQTSRDSFHQAFDVLKRLNEMGFLRLPEIESEVKPPRVPPPPAEPEPEPKKEEADESESDSTDAPRSDPGSGTEDDDDGSKGPEDSDSSSSPRREEDTPGDPSGGAGESDDSAGAPESGEEGDPEGEGSSDPYMEQGEGPDSDADSGKTEEGKAGSGSGSSPEGLPSESDPSRDSSGEASDNPEGSIDGSSGSSDSESIGSDETTEEPSEQEGSGSRKDSADEGPESPELPLDTDPGGSLGDPGGDDGSDTDLAGVDRGKPVPIEPSQPELEGETPDRNGESHGSDDGGETVDTGAAGEPIEVDITLDPNGSTIFAQPDDVNVELGDQLEPDERTAKERADDLAALKIAVDQGSWFETPARGVDGVVMHKFDEDGDGTGMEPGEIRRGENKVKVTDTQLRRPRQQMRLVFEANRRARMQRHLKSGRVNTRVLGKRAPLGDPRLFQVKRLPGKIDYRIVIGMDLSGSTVGRNLMIEKNAIYAQAELANGLGVPFEIYGHSGMVFDANLHIYPIKTIDEPWDDKTKVRLMNMTAINANLDGHALEFLRKRADQSTAAHTIILYYSDGKMPAENGPEELVILQREIGYCKQRGHTLIGVGIRTDSPRRHGLDTVQLDDMDDLPKVIAFLGKYLAQVNVK